MPDDVKNQSVHAYAAGEGETETLNPKYIYICPPKKYIYLHCDVDNLTRQVEKVRDQSEHVGGA